MLWRLSLRGEAGLFPFALLPFYLLETAAKREIRQRLIRINQLLEAKGNVDRHNEHFVGRAAELRSAIGMTDEEDGAADAVERTLHRRSVDQIVSLVGVPGQSR